MYKRAPDTYTLTLNNADLGNILAVDYAVRSVTAYWHFFITINGYISLGPTDTKCGDYVFILLGFNTLFVLRDY